MTWRAIPLLLTFAAAAACDRPEAERARGGGLGADVNNRPANVKMHEGSDQYWRTPERIGDNYPSLEPARQARELSRP